MLYYNDINKQTYMTQQILAECGATRNSDALVNETLAVDGLRYSDVGQILTHT